MVHIGKLYVEYLFREPLFTLVQAEVPCKWINDSQRLLLEWFDVIHDCPSQLYHIPLQFCPPSSWLCEHYASERSQGVRIVRGLPAGWGECFRTVTLDIVSQAIECWKDIVAVGSNKNHIIILDGITGGQKAVLSGHTDSVRSVSFSLDGTSLISGSEDKTVKLWDVQTGGVVRTFHGHTEYVTSVSVSADCTMVASGSDDKTIRLWNIQMGECYSVLEQQKAVYTVNFSPMDPQCLISISGGKVWQWDISGHKINPAHDSSHITFSLGKVQVVLCQGVVVIVQHFSRSQLAHCCCLIPGGRLIAVATGNAINVWDITSSDPHLIKTYVGHSATISSLVFSSPSTLISSSYDRSVKFWQIADLLLDPPVTNLESTPLASAPINFITLQAQDGIAISSDYNGVVSIWDISTGHCKASFQTPASVPAYKDAQLVNSRLIYVWSKDGKAHIWDAEKGEYQIVGTIEDHFEDVKISGDGSMVYCLYCRSLQAWSILTGETMGKVELEYSIHRRSLTVDSSRVWVHSRVEKHHGWDFGTPGSSPVELSITPPHLNKTTLWDGALCRIKDTITGGVVFQLGGRFMNPACLQWDGQYLVAGYTSGEVLILDFSCVLS